METTANLIIRVLCTFLLLFVIVVEVGVANEDGLFSFEEREK
jgi:hypothetical protein